MLSFFKIAGWDQDPVPTYGRSCVQLWATELIASYVHYDKAAIHLVHSVLL
mgnify:CR=1 FL=1